MAEVRLSRRAVSDIDALPDRMARRILDALERLGRDPRSDTLVRKRWSGGARGGDPAWATYRIVFRPTDKGRGILVARVVDRKELEGALRTLPD